MTAPPMKRDAAEIHPMPPDQPPMHTETVPRETEGVKRYRCRWGYQHQMLPDGHPDYSRADPDEFVRHADHLAARAADAERIKGLERDLRSATAWREEVSGKLLECSAKYINAESESRLLKVAVDAADFFLNAKEGADGRDERGTTYSDRKKALRAALAALQPRKDDHDEAA